ncbi:Na+/H+ antiporter NhaA [Prauserella muralis]|uniref:Na+/H+ antiporter NhaA n=1 Tax=Prauserella muralis TaxID=588067 RepID=UPI000DD46360|nr:Na+/H+ antiporter NhaA [Prauserella muralis]TWE27946.1 sodium/proton antiporter (NhaA family) [Prauserella muralis]
MNSRIQVLLGSWSWPERRRLAELLRRETVGGALLLAAAVAALIWANSPWSEAYEALHEVRIGPEALHLSLTPAEWAADGLLAIFFFVAGLELKREFVAGDLRDPRRALVPVVAACAGVVAPAVIFVAFNAGAGGDALEGWAVPTATDIAFALAVLAVIGRNLPSALRTFLLTLAVVDDLIAIMIIAVYYTDELVFVPLLLATIPLALFTYLVQRRVRSWFLLLPLAVTVWALVHASGVYATVAGVLLGFAVPVLRRHGEGPGLAEHFEHRFRPLSAGFAVPVFALLAAGVGLGGLSGVAAALGDSVALGIIVGLVAGKTIGILGATYLMARITKLRLPPPLAWIDVAGVAVLGGIGFTVSLLVGELAFGQGSERDEHVKVGVLAGSLVAIGIAAVILRARDRVHRKACEAENLDADGDGIPDVSAGSVDGEENPG